VFDESLAMDYYKLDSQYFWHPWSTISKDVKHKIIVQGDGCYVKCIDGKTYLDATSAALNASCGYNHPKIIKELTNQLTTLMNFDTKEFSTIPPIKLAKKISDLTPNQLTRTFFCSSGSEATETAVKISRMYNKLKNNKDKINIISLKGGYHGTTLCSLSMSHSNFVQDENEPFPRGFYSISAPVCEKCINFAEHNKCDIAGAEELEKMILLLGENTVSAFIMEPVMGIGGLIIPNKDYVRNVYSICKNYNVLFIMDETMTGFGRTGKMFGFEHFDIIPDILVTGKGISGGYFPMSAITTTEEIYETFLEDKLLKGFRHGHTNSGHASGAAAALATIQTIEEYNLVSNCKEKGNYLLNNMLYFQEKFTYVKNIRGLGLIIAMNFANDKICSDIINRCLDNGLIARQIGSVLGLLPPLTINLEQCDEIINKLEKALLSYSI
jgi:Adenosylmethionine-8-amino-7-oxononanoate aminotransferase